MYGFVIDCQYNRVYSHIMIPSLYDSSDKTSCFGDDAEQKRTGTAPSVESCFLESVLGPTTKGTGEYNAFV